MFAYSAILLEKEDHTSELFRLEHGSLGSFAESARRGSFRVNLRITRKSRGIAVQDDEATYNHL